MPTQILIKCTKGIIIKYYCFSNENHFLLLIKLNDIVLPWPRLNEIMLAENKVIEQKAKRKQNSAEVSKVCFTSKKLTFLQAFLFIIYFLFSINKMYFFI